MTVFQQSQVGRRSNTLPHQCTAPSPRWLLPSSAAILKGRALPEATTRTSSQAPELRCSRPSAMRFAVQSAGGPRQGVRHHGPIGLLGLRAVPGVGLLRGRVPPADHVPTMTKCPGSWQVQCNLLPFASVDFVRVRGGSESTGGTLRFRLRCRQPLHTRVNTMPRDTASMAYAAVRTQGRSVSCGQYAQAPRGKSRPSCQPGCSNAEFAAAQTASNLQRGLGSSPMVGRRPYEGAGALELADPGCQITLTGLL